MAKLVLYVPPAVVIPGQPHRKVSLGGLGVGDSCLLSSLVQGLEGWRELKKRHVKTCIKLCESLKKIIQKILVDVGLLKLQTDT